MGFEPCSSTNHQKSAEQLDILIKEQGDWDRESQDEIYANDRAVMRPGQDYSDARKEANRFVRFNICLARKLAAKGIPLQAMHALGRAMHTLQDSTSPARANFAEAWPDNLLQMADHVPHNLTEDFDPGAGSLADEQTLNAWKYFTGEKPMPADFFSDYYDLQGNGGAGGRAISRHKPSPDGGSCCN